MGMLKESVLCFHHDEAPLVRAHSRESTSVRRALALWTVLRGS